MATKDSTKKQPAKRKSSVPTCGIPLFAYMANMSDRAAYQAVADRKVKKVGRGALKLKDVFEYVMKREALGTETSNNEITDEEVQANKAMLEKARADLAETEVSIEKMKLVSRREIGGYMVNEQAIFKRELLSLSRTIPSTCYGMDKSEIVDELQRVLQKVYDERLEASEINAFVEAQSDSK